MLLTHLITHIFINKVKILSIYFFLQFIYFTIFSILYINNFYYWIFNIFIIFLSSIIISVRWQKIWMHWDTILQQITPSQDTPSTSWIRVTYFNFPKLVPGKIHPLFVKEILSHLRNRNYMRLKTISIALLIMLLLVIDAYFDDNYKSIFIMVCLGFIWYHYSHQFNEKYVLPESITFLRTMPFHFFQIGLAKFLSEFLYILLFSLIISCALLLHGCSYTEIIQVVSILFFFSIMVLSTITIFRIFFHDNPRAAGYAYHFVIIFFLIMIASQFYLVGPIVIFSLLIYFSYLSYRQFV